MGKTELHELRKDPLLGRWVAVLNQSKTPSEYVIFSEDNNEKDCFFCAGREKELPQEIMSMPNPGTASNPMKWWTRVIPNPAPIFRVEGEMGRKGEGMYDKMNSIGANEIIIESPYHSVRPEDIGIDQMARVLSTYRDQDGGPGE